MVTNAERARPDFVCNASATSSLPVPDSPAISTDVGDAATRSISENSCNICGDRATMLAVLILASFVGLGLGLAVSALARTSEVAIALIPLILIPMVIAGGMMKPVHELNTPMQAFADSMASRWAFEGMLLVESEARPAWTPPAPPATAAPPPQDLAERYFPVRTARFGLAASLAALLSMFGALAIAIMTILKLRDVH